MVFFILDLSLSLTFPDTSGLKKILILFFFDSYSPPLGKKEASPDISNLLSTDACVGVALFNIHQERFSPH